MDLIGRESEILTLKHCLEHSESRLIAMYGRRRVGKTFLIRNIFGSKIVLEMSGMKNVAVSLQIKTFVNALIQAGYTEARLANPKDWIDAFELLKLYLDSLKGKGKKVVFIDELPWFDTPRSNFVKIFENFWNQYCTKRQDIVVVICGSAASWMIKKIVKSKGALHNRVHEKIKLQPFNLYETERFLKAKGIVWDKYEMAQLYCCTGGIPFYLDGIRKGESLVQFINRSFFKKDGFLRAEYDELYSSLFDDSTKHQTIIELLAKHPKGLSREMIVTKSKLNSGGTFTKVLDELETSGFVHQLPIDSRSKTKFHYRLEDFYSFFYLHYIKNKNKSALDNWNKIYASPSWSSWSGFAFERICFAHIEQIKKALEISAIDCKVFSWILFDDERGAQIDMVIDRADRVANIVEMKFSKDEFYITKDYAKVLRNKLARYSEWAPRKILFLTLITNYGVFKNEYASELVQSKVELKQLFTKI